MTDSTNQTSEQKSSFSEELTDRSRDIWLAGLGALATVEEEGSKLFSELVEQGKDFQDARMKRLEGATEAAEEGGEKALGQLQEMGEETRKFLAGTMQQALGRLEVPTRSEVDDLATQVENLSAKVDALSQMLEDDEPTS